jgi:hypothetical protein
VLLRLLLRLECKHTGLLLWWPLLLLLLLLK